MDKLKKYVLSYGGGVNSSALYFYIVHEKELPLDLVIFADTGEESPETMESVEEMKLQCKKDNIPFEIVRSPYGRLVDYYYNKQSIPSMMKRDCTSKFKISPIRKRYKELFDRKKTQILQYIGIAYDELQRVSTSDVKYIDYSYPFVNDKITRQGNVDILKKYNFKASKSGCMGCMFQTKDKWRKFIKEHRKEFNRWKKMEENNRYYNRHYKLVDEMTETGNLIEDEDENGEIIYRKEKVPSGKKIKIPAKPLYLNGNYSLKQIENFEKYQKSLDKWTKDNDDDLTCPNTHGGCFL